MINHNTLIWLFIYFTPLTWRKAAVKGSLDNSRNVIPLFSNLYNENKLTVLNLKNQFTTKKIKYQYDPLTNIHSFYIKKPYLINSVKSGNNLIWSHEDGSYPEKVFIIRNENNEPFLRLFFPDEISQLSEPDISLSPTQEVESANLTKPQEFIDPYKKLIIVNIKNKFNTNLIKYYYDNIKNTHTFTSLQPNLIGRIIRNNNLIWEPETPKYPNKIFLFPDSLGNYTMRLIFPEPLSSSEHSPSEPIEPVITSSKKTLSTSTDAIHLCAEKKPISLNIDSRWNGANFDYTQTNNVGTYTSRDGYGFSQITSKNKFLLLKTDYVLWESYKFSEYAHRVDLIKYKFEDMFEVTLHLVNNIKKKFVKHRDLNWTEIDLNDLNPVIISINSIYETYSYNTEFDGKCRTFTPKTHFIFNGVRHGTNRIWQTFDSNEYSNKVKLINNKFIVEMKNNKQKVFEKISDNWVER